MDCRTMRMALWMIIGSMGFLPAAVSAVGADLDALCPVTFRGQRLGPAFQELADKLGVTYVLDDSVEPRALETPLRISVRYLTGREVFAWLARLGGLEVVFREGDLLLIKAGNLGDMGYGEDPGWSPGRAYIDPRWVAARDVRSPIEWTDAPLSRVVQDISAHFRIDLMVHSAIQDRHPLVLLNQPNASLEDVLLCLQDQLEAGFTFFKGALWAYPEKADRQGAAVSRPAVVVRENGDLPAVKPDRPALLEQRVQVSESVRSWADFVDFLNKLDGLSGRMDHEPEGAYPSIRAAGTVADVLDGLRLLNVLEWRYLTEGPGGIIVMAIPAED